MWLSSERRAVCVDWMVPVEALGADLVVHDSTQAHDADVDIIFFADQSGVFQRSPAGQCVEPNK